MKDKSPTSDKHKTLMRERMKDKRMTLLNIIIRQYIFAPARSRKASNCARIGIKDEKKRIQLATCTHDLMHMYRDRKRIPGKQHLTRFMRSGNTATIETCESCATEQTKVQNSQAGEP